MNANNTNPNEALTAQVVSRLIAQNLQSVKAEILNLQTKLTELTGQENVADHVTQTIDDNINCNESLDIIKSLPEFQGKANCYVSWRDASANCMSLYTIGSRRYFAALTILRNKIVSHANDVLTNHGTVLNYEAIISRLDFAYADKRPMHIIEQELSILRQGNMSVLDYYNIVNKKLTLLINKTIMTHGSNSAITKELNAKNRQSALRVFITGLQAPLSDILFSLSPSDLPNALAKAQELEANNIRAKFAYNFNKNKKQSEQSNENNLRYPKKEKQHENKEEPMDVDPSSSIYKHQTKFNNNSNDTYKKNHYSSNKNPNNKNKNYNNNNWRNNSNEYPAKHPHPTDSNVNSQPQQKAQRINNIEENHFLDRTPDSPTSTDGTEE